VTRTTSKTARRPGKASGNGGAGDAAHANGKDRRKVLVERELMQHACRLFAEKGYDGTSLTDIADGMGLTRAAVYYYFKNKEAVLEAIVRELTITPAREIEQWRSSTAGRPQERLKSFIRMRVLGVLNRRVEMRAVEVAEAALPPSLMKRHLAAKRQILEEYRSLVRDGILAGEFRPVDDRVAALTIIGMVNWTTRWFSPDRGQAAEDVAEQIAEMATQSVLLEETRRSALNTPAAAIKTLRQDLDHLAELIKSK
jgi:AcrR family transcriptional regulator